MFEEKLLENILLGKNCFYLVACFQGNDKGAALRKLKVFDEHSGAEEVKRKWESSGEKRFARIYVVRLSLEPADFDEEDLRWIT